VLSITVSITVIDDKNVYAIFRTKLINKVQKQSAQVYEQV